MRLVSFFFQVYLASMIQLVLELSIGGLAFEEAVKHFFPISSGLAWFASTYFLVYAFIPFIKKAMQGLRKTGRGYDIFIVAVLFFEAAFGFITPVNALYGITVMGFSIVFLGDWISWRKKQLYKLPLKTILVSSCMLNILAITFMMILVERIPAFESVKMHFIANNCPFVIIMACCLVLIFSRLKFSSKIVNALAATTFSVYITHSNPNWREYLWPIILDVPGHLDHWLLYLVPCVFIVFIIGIIYDIVFKHVIERMFEKIFSKLCTKADSALVRAGVIEDK